jgi:ribonuclease G
MAKNLLVINVDLRETRVALIEDGIIAELHLERASTRSTLGNIVLGKVTRVLPGMQAAFIDIGQDRAAFLHVEDLIRPDDFEAYMSGGKRPDAEENYDEVDSPGAAAESTAQRGADRASSNGISIAIPDAGHADAAEAEAAEFEDAVSAEEADVVEGAEGDEEDGELGDAEVGAASDAPAFAEGGGSWAEAADVEPEDDEEDEDDRADLDPASEAAIEVLGEVTSETVLASEPVGAAIGFTAPAGDTSPSLGVPPRAARPVPEAGAMASVVPAPSGAPPDRRGPRPDKGQGPGRKEQGRGDGHSFRTKRSARSRVAKRGRGNNNTNNNAKQNQNQNGGRRNGQRDASRLSRSTPIREVVREGQEVVVQVSKEPIGTKGARVTSHVALAGRYVVYMPTIDQIGISKRIGSEKERARLREAIESIKPPTGGLIVRTVAEGLTKKQLKADVGYLVRLWEEVGKKKEAGGKSPMALFQELDLVLKTARDLFTDDIKQIVIDDREQYQRLVRFVEMFMPERVKDIVLYAGDEPIFDAYGIEDEISRALSRKVPLSSGGYLIIDQAEALTAIDVNTGRYVGKGSKDLEDTLLKTNLEAVEEIAYQLRFRNLGGLIVLDLIDMERASNREKVRRRLEDLLQKDKAKTTLNRISDLGLIEMTRKRTRESLGRLMHEPCFYCDGTGQLQSKQTVVYEILRQLRRDRAFLPGYSVLVNAHPAVIDLMKGEEREAVTEAERRFMRRIELVPRKEYHMEQFDLAGK